MGGPPPPPPPMAPPAPVMASSGNEKERSALLKQIERGRALKKTQTNDRSAPTVDGELICLHYVFLVILNSSVQVIRNKSTQFTYIIIPISDFICETQKTKHLLLLEVDHPTFPLYRQHH